MSIRCDNSIAVRWYGLNALEFRHRNGSFMIDPYVSRSPEKITIPEEVEKYLVSRPDFVLMTHSHWDHLPDMPLLIRRTGTVLYASRTACNIMRSLALRKKICTNSPMANVSNFPGASGSPRWSHVTWVIPPERSSMTDRRIRRHFPDWKTGGAARCLRF